MQILNIGAAMNLYKLQTLTPLFGSKMRKIYVSLLISDKTEWNSNFFCDEYIIHDDSQTTVIILCVCHILTH